MEDIKQQAQNNKPKHRRGRYGILGGSNKIGDFNRYLFLAKTHDYVLFFTNKGQAYMLRGYQIPEAGRKVLAAEILANETAAIRTNFAAESVSQILAK